MSRLVPNSTPAERAVKCSFAETLENAAAVVANDGTIYGTPTIDFGAVLDGSNDYIKYDLTGNEFDSDEISIVVEFWPDFDPGENATRFIISTDDIGINYQLVKRDNAANNTLRIMLGGTVIANIAEASYSPYWKVGERNVLQVSGTSADTSAELNGINILSSDSTVWSAQKPLALIIGATTGTASFDGKIGHVKIFKSILTAQDALNYYNHDNYNYMESALIHLPMRAEQHDPTNVRTLDVSGNENHATLGDGSTPSTYPTKLQKRGYSFDGGNYLKTGTITLPSTTECTFACVLKTVPLTGTDYIMELADVARTNIFATCFIAAGTLYFASGGNAAANRASSAANNAGLNTVIGVHDGSNTQIYVNGVSGTAAATPLNPVIAGTQIAVVGSDAGVAIGYNGDIGESLILPIGLTPLQAADLHLRMLKQVNHV